MSESVALKCLFDHSSCKPVLQRVFKKYLLNEFWQLEHGVACPMEGYLVIFFDVVNFGMLQIIPSSAGMDQQEMDHLLNEILHSRMSLHMCDMSTWAN